MKKRLIWLAVTLAVIAGAGYGVMRFSKVALASSGTSEAVPTTKVKKGQVRITVAARGELQGGNSEMLTAPMVGGGDLPITTLRQPGELVAEGDVVAQFDTTQQEYNLREAQADLAEAEQQVIKAQAESEATAEESRWAVVSAESEVKIAEWEMKRNPVEPAIVQKQNELALQAANDRLRQSRQDLKNKETTSSSGIAIQMANQNKAKVMSELAQKNIDSMTLKAKTAGYVNIQQNTNMNMMYWGMQLPPFQVGDSARSGMAVAQIPDLKSWEISAKVGELDRGRLNPGQPVTVKVVALAGKEFTGKVKNMGGTSGPPWDRNFETRISLDAGSPELRPGMTSNLVIVAETIENVLWVPFQAVFESDGRSFVYKQTPNGFMPQDIKMVKRSESQVVLEGLSEGDTIAMSNPDQSSKAGQAQQGQQNGAMKALSK